MAAQCKTLNPNSNTGCHLFIPLRSLRLSGLFTALPTHLPWYGMKRIRRLRPGTAYVTLLTLCLTTTFDKVVTQQVRDIYGLLSHGPFERNNSFSIRKHG